MKSTDDRVREIMRGRRNIRRLPLPGSNDHEIEIGVRILLDEEMDAARADAVKFIESRAKTVQLEPADIMDCDPGFLSRETHRQIVFRAIIDADTIDSPKGEQPFFPSPQSVRQADTVMVEVLYQVYKDHQEYVNPLLRLTSQEEVDKLVDELGKGLAAEAILSLYDAPSLRTLLHTLASRLTPAQTGK